MYGMRPAEGNGEMSMICLLCGRKLKTPRSREAGYGPVCYKRKFGISPHADRSDGNSPADKKEPDYNLPGQMSIYDFPQMIPEK